MTEDSTVITDAGFDYSYVCYSGSIVDVVVVNESSTKFCDSSCLFY